jgi:hypothetical protein
LEERMTDYAEGSCFCGKVTFRAARPAHWIGHCHCTQCRRISGAAFVTWAGFKTDDYAIHDPEGLFRRYSSGRAERGICSGCGSPFYFRYDRPHADAKDGWDKGVFFTLANINPPFNQKPECHIYYEDHAKWLDHFEDLPKFDWSSPT